MALAVKSKLRATGPLIPDSPDHCCPVLLIERIVRFNEEKYPVLLLFVFLLEDAYRMNGALYPRLHPSGELCLPPALPTSADT